MFPPRVGLVLGAGGLSGEAFHRGVIRALQERAGWDARTADVVVGTSAGSLVAATIRAPHAPPPAADVAAEMAPLLPPPVAGAYEYVMAALRRPWGVRPAGLLAALVPAGKQSTELVQEGVRRRYGAHWPDQPLYVVATRRGDGARVVFGYPDGPGTDVASAVGASCAVPGIFAPVFIDGQSYVDGGLGSPTNADVLAKADLDLVIVSSPMSIAPAAVRPRADLSLRLMWHRRLMRETRTLRARGVSVLLIEPDRPVLARLRLHPVRIGAIDEVEDEAYALTVRTLARWDASMARGERAA